MTNKEEELITRGSELISDITNYLVSIPNWIYYFLNPIAGGNEELFDCIEDHPDDWEDYIDFYISNINGSIVQIKIHINDYTDCGITLSRYINLFNFGETVEKNKMLYDGKLYEIRKQNIEEEIIRLKDALNKKEEELKNLKK